MSNYWVDVAPEDFKYGESYTLRTWGREGEATPVRVIEHSDYGDYGGSGTVGMANYKVFEDDFADKVAFATADYGYRAVIIPTDREVDEEVQEAINSLKSYPLLSDDVHSEVEMEIESEAWSEDGMADFIKQELKPRLMARFNLDDDRWDEMEEHEKFNELVYDLYREISSNADPGHYEGGSWYFPLDNWGKYIDKYPAELDRFEDIAPTGDDVDDDPGAMGPLFGSRW